MTEISTNLKISKRKLSALKPYEKNPRLNDEAVPIVAESIRRFGFKVPIVIDSDGVIVAGHTRYKAAQELGLETVPCIVADDLTPEEIKAFRLADNKAAEVARWDVELLNEELLDLGDADMELFGFEDPDLESGGGYDDETGDETDTTPGFTYHEQYGVIVLCSDEAEQEKVYNKLVADGYECKVVTT